MIWKYIKMLIHIIFKHRNSIPANIVALIAFIMPIICRIYFYFDNAVPEIKSLDLLFTLILSIALIDFTILFVTVLFFILHFVLKRNFDIKNNIFANNLCYNIIFMTGYILSILSVSITLVWYLYQLFREIW